ncbi:thermonuclease family protein [Thioclava sp.]|uniref:thermonuclease family protein n=1 Tax=Thioclava sp. TaxID=1933450 RepID=UPI003AA7D8CB
MGWTFALLAVVYLAAKPTEHFPEYSRWLVKWFAMREITGAVTHVRDGDTIEVSGVPIRFSSLNCAELGTPAGERAKKAMLGLVSGRELSCYLNGSRSYDRFIGSCYFSNGKNVSAMMIHEGICTRYW